jgi:NADH-quinone oxidoreductase chain I
VIGHLKSIGRVSWSLAKGMWITLKYMFSPAITVQYPTEKLVTAERYRGALAFHPDVCISCEMCVRACPSACISLDASRNEQTKKKDLLWYKIDFAKCNYCRLCEEICPTKPKAVHHSHEYELSFTSRADFVVEWTPDVPQPAGRDPGQVWSKFLAKGSGPLAAKTPAPAAAKARG